MSLRDLGLKCGIEIHQQLTGRKLFSSAQGEIVEHEPDFVIERVLRASAGEGGVFDAAALAEQQRSKKFFYEGHHGYTSLVEVDEEPPHAMSKSALSTALSFCHLVQAKVADVAQVMRKIVVDGSNTSGFQRTALIARGGYIETSHGVVRLENVSLEEDSCRIIKEDAASKTYRLDRLGIPLIEIGTAPDIRSPEQCLETAQTIGMYLRSLSGVRRGLGTIRQDVNVSIAGGERVEIKGAQDLKMIPTLVELEAKRQQELLLLRDELSGKEIGNCEIVDVSSCFTSSQAKRVSETLSSGGVMLGMKIDGFSGLLGRELAPNYRVGSELAGRAKIAAGVGGIFHSDELPAYGVSEEEVASVREALHVSEQDGFILVCSEKHRARLALEACIARVRELFVGVPKEVRKARADGTTQFLRPMPGSARMYPETDVPLVFPDMSTVEKVELLNEKKDRFVRDYSIVSDLAGFIVKNGKAELFEELVGAYSDMKAAFIGEVLVSVPLEIKRKYEVDISGLTDDSFRELFSYLDQDKIHKDIVLDVLLDMAKGEFDLAKYESLSTEEIHRVIRDVVAANANAPFGALMGKCMAALKGKASGQIISSELKKIMSSGHK